MCSSYLSCSFLGAIIILTISLISTLALVLELVNSQMKVIVTLQQVAEWT